MNVDLNEENISVGALVHMITGMDRFLLTYPTAHNSNNTIGDHFVHIHVGQSARTHLPNTERKVIVEFSSGPFITSFSYSSFFFDARPTISHG